MKRERLFVDRLDRVVDGDGRFVREQHPLRLDERAFEPGDPWQDRRQPDDEDAEADDRPMWPAHVYGRYCSIAKMVQSAANPGRLPGRRDLSRLVNALQAGHISHGSASTHWR